MCTWNLGACIADAGGRVSSMKTVQTSRLASWQQDFAFQRPDFGTVFSEFVTRGRMDRHTIPTRILLTVRMIENDAFVSVSVQ